MREIQKGLEELESGYSNSRSGIWIDILRKEIRANLKIIDFNAKNNGYMYIFEKVKSMIKVSDRFLAKNLNLKLF